MASVQNPDWPARFLEVFAATCNVLLSAKGAGIDRDIVYKRRKLDPEFAAAMDSARDDALDTLEAEAWKRARDTSDNLLMFLLKAHRRELYGDTVRIDIRAEAERIAAEVGIDVDSAIAEAERIMAGH